MKRLRRIIVAGLLVWLPLGITIFVVKILIDLLGQTYLLIPEALRPENLFGVTIPGIGIIMAIIVLFATGLIAANYLGKTLVDTWERFLDKIPLVRYLLST